jgi:hypothetical protein
VPLGGVGGSTLWTEIYPFLSGGPECSSSPPQQAMVPSLLTPHVKKTPALTEANVPAGGSTWPNLLSPQQATVPSTFRPHVWAPPALTEAKASVAVPPGETDAPGVPSGFFGTGERCFEQDAAVTAARNKAIWPNLHISAQGTIAEVILVRDWATRRPGPRQLRGHACIPSEAGTTMGNSSDYSDFGIRRNLRVHPGPKFALGVSRSRGSPATT